MRTVNKIKISIFSFALLLGLFSLLSCNNALSNSKENSKQEITEQKNEANKGNVRIIVNTPNENARTVLPEIDITKLENISLTGLFDGDYYGLGSWDNVTELQNETLTLDLGSWELELSATYNDFTFSATETVTIELNTTTNVTFQVTPETINGGFSLKVAFDSSKEADHVLYSITNYFTGSVVENNKTLSIKTGSGQKYILLEKNRVNPIAGGTYLVVLRFYGDADNTILLNTWTELIRVKSGFISPFSRTIDLNSIYKIKYFNTEDASITSGSLVQNYSINTDCSTITFPTMSKSQYVFRGWYATAACTGSPLTSLPANSEGDVNIYAKWEPFHPLEYKIINYSNEVTSTLTAAQMTSYNLPDMHDPSGPTDLSVCTITDGESHNISCDFYYDYDSTSGCSNQITGDEIAIDAIAEDKTSATTIYIKPNITHVYLDPGSGGNDGNWPFDVSTPAKSVAAARKWVGTGDSYTLYVKNQISSYTDIQNLSNGPLVKRYKTVTKTLIQITSLSLNLENVIIDGGADWGTVDANASVYNLTKNGINSTGAIIGIVATTRDVTVNMTNVTIQNNDNTYSSQGGLLINTQSSYTATLNLTDCIIQNCRCQGDGGGFRVLGKSNVTITRGTFAHNAALGGGVSSDAGDGGAIAIMTENGASSVTANGTTFTANKAKDSGGAIFINGSSDLSTISGCSFSYNSLNDSTGLGKTICVFTSSSETSNLKISGANTSPDSNIEIFTDAVAPIQVTSDTSLVSPSGNSKYIIIPIDCYTAGTPPTFDKKVLDFTGLTSAQITSVKSAFILGGSLPSQYEIDYDGVIKPKAGSLIVVPGFPNLYKCGYTMTTSGTTRTIAISIKDTFNNAVSTSQISDLKVTIFDHGDVVKTITGNSVYSFTYPVYLDDPNDHTFYVEFTLKSDENSSVVYYYDFYAASGI